MIYYTSLVIIIIVLFILIRVWKGSDLGFWVISCLLVLLAILLVVIFCGWVYFRILPMLA